MVRFHFILYLYRTIFKKTLVWFQQEQPLIHVLFNECCNILRNVLLCFVKEEVVAGKQGSQLLSISYELQNNQRIDSKIEIGESTRKYLSDLSSNEKIAFYKDVREIYCTITVSITPSLLDSVKNAYSRYRTDQERQQQLQKEKEIADYAAKSAKNKDELLVEKELDLLEKQKLLQGELNNATRLLEEGDQRLKAAIDAKNFYEIETAGILIDSSKKKLMAINTEIVQNNDALNQLRKKFKK
ncbi:unnamed protein product [Rotaria sordida]|uniref:Uncharacterized protein n=1 Tax=Rotaria sordida TaxID=392033 RepID=A0A815V4X2_9BILA|nr:unnamed protein product [Rotaria sordida]